MSSFEAIKKTEKLYVRVAELISDAIKEGKFNVGEKLPAERELASQLQVSRPSVREALAVLEIMGVVRIRVGDGTYVQNPLHDFHFELSKMKKSSPEELIEARYHIESIVIQLVIDRATEADIREIEETNEKLKSLLDDNNSVEAFFTHGVAFHKKLAEATHNEVVSQIAHSLVEQDKHPLWQHLNKQALLTYEGRCHQLNEHLAILDAIKTKDAEKAKQLMSHHLAHLKDLFYQ